LANASYIREINNGGGELLEVGRAISALADPRQKIPLPQDEIEADLSSENWQYWYRASLTDGLQSFLSDEFNWSIDLTEASEKTSRFEDRWSAGAGFSYFAVFGANGGADNETIRKHAELDTSAIKIHFSNIQSFTVDRGNWFKPGVISQFRDRMPPGFWGEAGRLNLIPTQVILVRGLRIEVLTSAQVTDYFFNKKSAGGGAGFRIGPWRIGGSGHRTTIEESYEMHRSSTGFLLEDVSQRAQILAVTSIRNIDLLKQTEDPAPTYRMLAEPEIREARALLDRARRAAPSALESLGVS
jgi:hypothetical protein